ncbi:GNAT family N-acetyltransferase [Arthrobacter castelli]|uniref:GNAT family N-acetyltransferase n=1 Tax=Arthrobacter castelli TaxID=271431 RepID=UPI00047BF060|nr:GNAT family N-acetyltransferase [Arthrobacter castelli]
MELRSTTAYDLQIILDWMTNNKEMVMWSGPSFKWPLDHGQLQNYLQDPNRVYWSAVDSDSPRLVGHASLLIDQEADLMRIGYIVVDPERRGRGIGRKLVESMVRYGFESSHIPVMKLGVYAHNAPAISLYEGLGFSRTGVVLHTEVDQEDWTVIEMARARVPAGPGS